ncbi:mitochondrial ubiquitin ligase activator of nfkb 1-A-like, partial [Oreochromis niloticus]
CVANETALRAGSLKLHGSYSRSSTGTEQEGEREKESQGQEQETTSSHQKEGLDNTEIRVLSPLPAAGLDKEVTYEKFHQVSHSLGDLVGQYFTGEKPKGQLEIEGILKVGTNITGVGELKLDTDGTLSLRPPSNGSQYFLTPVDFDATQGENENFLVESVGHYFCFGRGSNQFLGQVTLLPPP